MSPEVLKRRFTSVPPETLEQAEEHLNVNAACDDLAQYLNALIPDESREKSLAITYLEEVMMWANKALVMQRAPKDVG